MAQGEMNGGVPDERGQQERGSGEQGAGASWAVRLVDEAATERLARVLAEQAQPGDLFTLTGELGAGKTTFARAFVRAFAGDAELEVPSPTFTLMQVYEVERGTVVHADLYRIAEPQELDNLGWDETADGAVVLVEWAERAGEMLEGDRFDISFRLVPGSGGERIAVIMGYGDRAKRVTKLRALRTVLDRAGWGDAARLPLYGDASTRLYERLLREDGKTAILMTSPPRPPSPPVRYGKPYHVVARLSDSVRAFVAVDLALRELGLSAPDIYGHDLETGLVLLEDLGSEPFTDADGPIVDRYMEAVRLLAWLHAREVPSRLPLPDGEEYSIPPYDLDAMTIEVDLLLEWYLPHHAGRFVPAAGRKAFGDLWNASLEPVLGGAGRKSWALRDFHSPNLIWLAGREGIQRVGLIDFQDAVMCHPAYDLVSLLQDARVTVPPELELKLLALYARERREHDPDFDMEDMTRAYAILGAQRATKLFGLFVRLDQRDGKPQYMAHLPRIGDYLRRDLAHPALEGLRAWFSEHAPQLATGA